MSITSSKEHDSDGSGRRLQAALTLRRVVHQHREGSLMARGGEARLACAAARLLALAAVCSALPSACDRLHAMFAHAGPVRQLSVHGEAVPLRVYWDSAPSRAAAALLAAALRHVARYDHVELLHARLCDLATDLTYPDDSLYYNIQQVALMPMGLWEPNRAACAARASGPARLHVLGPGAPALPLRLYALLPDDPSPFCRNFTRWLFYKDNFVYCDFIVTKDTEISFEFYYLEEWKATSMKVVENAAVAGVTLQPIQVGESRSEVARARPRAALLLDYGMWEDARRVQRVEPPPGAPLPAPQTVRAADEDLLRAVAPGILRLFTDDKLTSKDLIGDIVVTDNIEEAACNCAANSSYLSEWSGYFNSSQYIYEIVLFLCENDPDHQENDEAMNVVSNAVIASMGSPFTLILVKYLVRCEDEHSLMRLFTERIQSVYWSRMVGALGAGAGVRAAAGVAGALDTALVAYDVPAAPLPPAARAVSASVPHLAIALSHFMSTLMWSRLVVLSEDSELATNLYVSLNASGSLILKSVPVKPIHSALEKISEIKGRIIFVNANAHISTSVMCGALESGMTTDAGYVWILREWHAVDIKCGNESIKEGRLAPYTISFWRRGAVEGGSGVGGGAAAAALERRWPRRAWPLHAAPMADALVLLLHSFQDFLLKHPERKTDLHGGNATRFLWENVKVSSLDGVSQKLELNRYGLTNPFVFIDQWYGSRREQRAVWQIYNGTVRKISKEDSIMSTQIPSDGSISCMTKPGGDAFSPVCYDFVVWTAVGAAALAAPALVSARRARRARLQRRDQQRAAGLLARGRRAAALAPRHLVDRAHLDTRHELGSGRAGRVRFAILRKPGRSSIAVAVKALRDEVSPAEEQEFLNEACVLASLKHDHVVRLVGVCAIGGPPLLLMEYAFFGDLQKYLSERRYLSEERNDAEARYVSAPALTRLGRDAAAALEFLAQRRIVHRDVRAANCLVDSRRKLKLGDFGMARRADVGADGEAEYACRRRGLFPVLWMAPESLERGVFSAASDAWALGVLLLELVTLGARPYADWSPLRVMRFVSAGGSPPLPADISPDTRSLLEQCWQRAADARPAAAELRAALEARPGLLRPAAPAGPGTHSRGTYSDKL